MRGPGRCGSGLASGFRYSAFRRDSLRSYTDYASVSTYAYDAMAWAVDAGYVKGSGAKLNPGSNATRAEVVVMLHRYLTK